MPKYDSDRFDKARDVDIAYILKKYGVKADKNERYHCPVHNDKKPSASIYKQENKLKCFSCNSYLSTIDLVMQVEGVDKIKAVNLILKDFEPQNRVKKLIDPIKEKQKKFGSNVTVDFMRKYSNKIYKLKENKYIESYLKKRCIEDMVKELSRFGVTVRHNYYKNVNYIIYDFGTYMIQKAVTKEEGQRRFTRNIGSPDVFVMEYDKNLPYGIVEGLEDGLSLLKAFDKQINIICLNSVANKKKLFGMIEGEKRYKNSTFIFALDNDNAGITVGKEIKGYLMKNDIKFDYYMNFYKAASSINCIKDINDYIIYLNKTTKEGKYDPKN